MLNIIFKNRNNNVIFEGFVFYIICNMLRARLCIKQISSYVCAVNLFLLKTITFYGPNDKDRSQTEIRTSIQPIQQHRPLSRFQLL